MKSLKFDAQGLLIGIAQHAETGQVLMVAMMNQAAVDLSLETGLAHFWSRSRQSLWLKGETSGNILEIKQVRADCDGAALLLLVHPRGPACHTGEESCFFTELELKS
jgi:phosphoribosyl-AMP cyclohydrolase